MKKIITLTALLFTVISINAQNIKIKKGEILLDKKVVAKIDKQKNGFKISSLDGEAWFVANTINITQTRKVAPKFWLELTGANGNLREAEFGNTSFTFSKSKGIVQSLLVSDSGLFTEEGVNKGLVEEYFQTEDRRVSEKWDAIIIKQLEENAEEDRIAKADGLLIDSYGTITLKRGDKLGYVHKKANSSNDQFTYTVVDINGHGIASINFRQSENFNNQLGLNLNTYDGQILPIYQVDYSFSKIKLDDLTRRIVHRLYALGYLQPEVNDNDLKNWSGSVR